MTTFKPQKVQALKDALKLKTPKLHGNYFITEKIEGWFVYIGYNKKLDLWISPRSSTGRIIPALEHTVEYFSKLPKPHTDCILITEVALEDTPFHITNGILNRSVGNYKCENPLFYFHDIYYPQAPHTSYQTRYHSIQDLEDYFNQDYFRLLPILHVGEFDLDVWKHYFDKIANAGGEGIVGVRENSLYLPGKRTSDILKLKLECTIDCLADSLEEGFGKKLEPSLTLISKRKNGAKIRTVISKHEDQERFRSNPSCILGKVVEIKAMEEYEDGTLRQPVFKYIREDKTIEDID